jgi:hypothetical protein
VNTAETNYGVCRLSLVPVRAEPGHAAEQVNQLLFGEHYEVLERNNDSRWIRVRNHFDGFEGWLDARQHHPISAEHFEYINSANFKITTDITASILHNKNPLQVLMGSIIPISGTELFKMEEQFAFNGDAKNLGQKRDVDFLKAMALKYLNAPFMPGGRSPFGIYPAAFTQMAYKLSGYALGYAISQQQKEGKPVNEDDDVAPGDLVFFKNIKDGSSHVGILLAEDRVIHVAEKVRIDHFDEEGILAQESRIYTHTFLYARRVLPPE